MLALLSVRGLWTALLIFARAAGILRMVPVIGGKAVSRSIRTAEAVLLAFLIFPSLWYAEINVPETASEQLFALVSEFLIGLTAGAVPAILFSALTLAGGLIGRIGGFSAASLLDPELGEENGALSLLLRLTGIAVFLAAGGLERLAAGLLDLFEKLPPGSSFNIEAAAMNLTHILTDSAVFGVQLALPVFLALAALWIGAAVLNRVIPRLNFLTMTMTFSGNLLAVLAVLHVSLGSILLLFQTRLPDWGRFFPTLFMK